MISCKSFNDSVLEYRSLNPTPTSWRDDCGFDETTKQDVNMELFYADDDIKECTYDLRACGLEGVCWAQAP